MRDSTLKYSLELLQNASSASSEGSLELVEIALMLCKANLESLHGEGVAQSCINRILCLLDEFEKTPRATFQSIRRLVIEENIARAAKHSLDELVEELSDALPRGSETTVVETDPHSLKIAILCVTYFPTEIHKLIAGAGLRSLSSEKYELDFISVVNFASVKEGDHTWLQKHFDHVRTHSQSYMVMCACSTGTFGIFFISS